MASKNNQKLMLEDFNNKKKYLYFLLEKSSTFSKVVGAGFIESQDNFSSYILYFCKIINLVKLVYYSLFCLFFEE